MAASSKLMIVEAERRFPCRIKLGIPVGGYGGRLTEMQAWLDQNCGADGWAMTPAGRHGVVNDAVAIYFLDATSAAAFVSRWCAGSKSKSARGRSECARIDRRKGLSSDRTRRSEGATKNRMLPARFGLAQWSAADASDKRYSARSLPVGKERSRG
jgi:hypothetical protein